MLDVSIPELRKEKKLDEKKFLAEPNVKIVEKFDGTKLTLVRNDLPRNNDFALNWIVSYKGSVMFPPEFLGVSNDMLEHSVGVAQYKRVFDLLRAVPSNVDVEPGIELFVEFIQNKTTLTRDYERFLDLFLIGYSKCEHFTLGLRTYTTSEDLNVARNEELASKLGLKLPPVLHEGPLSPRFASVKHVIETFSNFESSLGGRAEGVVIMHGDRMFKVVAPDQYDKEVRKAKKMRFALDEPHETEYWTAMKAQAASLVQQLWHDDASNMMHCLSLTIYDFKQKQFKGQNPKKNLVMHRDDLMLTAKLAYEEMRELRGTNIGVIPMAGKPLHAGHWLLIEKASQESETVYLFVSNKGRGEGSERIRAARMLKVWKELLIPKLPRNVIVKFVDSPVYDANCFVKNSGSHGFRHFTFYGDAEDVASRWSTEILQKTFDDVSFVHAVGVARTNTVSISATEMRNWLATGSGGLFMAHLPQVLNHEERERYLRILLGMV